MHSRGQRQPVKGAWAARSFRAAQAPLKRSRPLTGCRCPPQSASKRSRPRATAAGPPARP